MRTFGYAGLVRFLAPSLLRTTCNYGYVRTSAFFGIERILRGRATLVLPCLRTFACSVFVRTGIRPFLRSRG